MKVKILNLPFFIETSFEDKSMIKERQSKSSKKAAECLKSRELELPKLAKEARTEVSGFSWAKTR